MISVVVPVYRSASTLEELHRRLAAALSGEEIELIFVDDACPEGSAGVLRRLGAADPRVRILTMEGNAGQHRALLRGLASARGEAAVILDADLQDPPEAVPLLLAALRRGPAAVFAGRRGAYESAARLFTSRVFKAVLSAAAGLPRDAGLFVALRRPLIDRLVACRSARPYLPAIIGLSGMAVESLPVERARRPRGESSYRGLARLRTGLSALAFAIGERWRRRKG